MAVIETHQLTKTYDTDHGTVTAVDGVDLAIDAGEVFGFLGPNGAGKSTTINMLLDYVRPSSGQASILGQDVHEHAESLRRQIGVLPEGLGLYNRLTGRRHLEFAIDWADSSDDPDRILKRVGLSPADADRPVGDYSTGMRQRLALGMATIGDPDVLILDEPSSGLDPHGIQTMRELVRAEADRGTTVFFSSHILGEVEAVCDRVGILHDGELVAVDDIAELRETVASGSELRLRVTEEIMIDLTALQGVESMTRAGNILRVTVSTPRVKARVITELNRAGVEILDVDSEEPSLEDVFTAYTSGDEAAAASQETGTGEEVTV